MPIKVEALSKEEFQHWLGDAKKKFVRHDDGIGAVRIAAAPDPAEAARPAPTGN
jgi:heme/copper-type cytochrome/quinol oxidase subunit 2